MIFLVVSLGRFMGVMDFINSVSCSVDINRLGFLSSSLATIIASVWWSTA